MVVLGAQDDARARRIEVARDQVEHPGLLVEGLEDPLERNEVGELGLLEEARGSVVEEAVLALLPLERAARERRGRARGSGRQRRFSRAIAASRRRRTS